MSEFLHLVWVWSDYLNLNVALCFRLLCVRWYVVLLHRFVFWFYIIYDISISLCVCVLDMQIILHMYSIFLHNTKQFFIMRCNTKLYHTLHTLQYSVLLQYYT